MARKLKPKRKTKWARPSRMMVIRVAVPARDVPEMKACRVYGVASGRYQELRILNAYYDVSGQPDAFNPT
jgi:hypothetical protein